MHCAETRIVPLRLTASAAFEMRFDNTYLSSPGKPRMGTHSKGYYGTEQHFLNRRREDSEKRRKNYKKDM